MYIYRHTHSYRKKNHFQNTVMISMCVFLCVCACVFRLVLYTAMCLGCVYMRKRKIRNICDLCLFYLLYVLLFWDLCSKIVFMCVYVCACAQAYMCIGMKLTSRVLLIFTPP